MHAWEKALNAAKRLRSPHIRSIGFQHGGISINYFFYFHHPSEMIQEEKSTALPLPDILACNGDISLNFMRSCKYPDIRKVEAIRHLYLSDYLNNSNLFNKQKVVLVAGSIDRKEAKSLISMFYEAFPKPEGFQVWLKGHPSLPFKDILRELKIDARECGYIIKYESLDELLKPTKILIVGSSAVAIEGLAGGCRVISPIFSDSITMSHLIGFEKYHIQVFNSEELKDNVEKIIEYSENKENYDEIKKFISSYWCLDMSLIRWEKLLK